MTGGMYVSKNILFACAAGLALVTSGAKAQTDYYNTDTGRPLQIEDAYALEHRGVEIQIAPLRLERARSGVYHWAIEPELAIGLFPRTQLEIGVPLTFIDGGRDGRKRGLSGIDISVLHNLNTETSIPALGIVGEVLVPVGGLGPDRAYVSAKAIATKSFSVARFHLNGQYTFGDRIVDPRPAQPSRPGDAVRMDDSAIELSQWLAGVAVDRTMPLRSLLVSAELFARQPLREVEVVEYNTAGGVRYQLSPRLATDAGAGYRLTGGDKGWFVTFGAAYAFGLPWSRR